MTKKRNKLLQFEQRLERIREFIDYSRQVGGNSYDLQRAVKQFGNHCTEPVFLSSSVQSLQLYDLAVEYDAKRKTDGIYVARVEELFNELTKEIKDTRILEEAESVYNDAVERYIEKVPILHRHFSAAFITSETRHLDETYKDKATPISMYYLGAGVTEVEHSNIMLILAEFANDIGYYAGVLREELEPLVKGYGIDSHITHGFLKEKKYIEDFLEQEVIVPLRF